MCQRSALMSHPQARTILIVKLKLRWALGSFPTCAVPNYRCACHILKIVADSSKTKTLKTLVNFSIVSMGRQSAREGIEHAVGSTVLA